MVGRGLLPWLSWHVNLNTCINGSVCMSVYLGVAKLVVLFCSLRLCALVL